MRAVPALMLVVAALGISTVNTVPARAGGDPVLLAAGDVGTCDATGALAGGGSSTARLLQKEPAATVAMLGDGAYDLSRAGSGSDANAYANCYDPSWGQPDIKSRTRPTPGDNDYEGSPQAADYFGYFNGAGSDRLGYYSYDLGAWHVVVLNSECDPTAKGGLGNTAVDGCGADSTMGRWLSADLAAHRTACTMAYWHSPRFFSFTSAGPKPPAGNTNYDSDPTMNAMWQILQRHHADVVLSGHRHVYERFPQLVLPTGSSVGPGTVDRANGIREFVVGTGGGPHHHFDPDPRIDPSQTIYEPNSEVHIQQAFGVLRLTLHAGAYDWQYLDAGQDGKVLDSGTDTCHEQPEATTTTTTAAPTTPTTGGTLPPHPQAGAPAGYWMLGSAGTVYPFGSAGNYGNGAGAAVHIEPTPSGNGYWLLGRDGRVQPFGDALRLGGADPGQLTTGETASSLSATPSGKGYWVFTSRGRALAFGDAAFLGDVSNLHLNGPVLGSVATPSGRGYYMVASDGGIFAFGDAAFRGSMGGVRLNAPVQSLVPFATGGGYWLVASDGGIFAFGDAAFRGSMGGKPLNKPVVGMVRYADGYLMVAADGGIFDFSSSPFLGSLGANPPAAPVVSVAAMTSSS